MHLGQYEGTDCRYATTNLMRRSSLPSPTRRLLQRMKTWLPRPPSPAPVIVCSERAVTDMAPAPSNEHVAPAPAVTSAVRAWLIESSPTRRLLHQMYTLLQHLAVTSAVRAPVIEYASSSLPAARAIIERADAQRSRIKSRPKSEHEPGLTRLL